MTARHYETFRPPPRKHQEDVYADEVEAEEAKLEAARIESEKEKS